MKPNGKSDKCVRCGKPLKDKMLCKECEEFIKKANEEWNKAMRKLS